MNEPAAQPAQKRLWIGLLVGIALLERAVLYFIYPPIATSNDTGGYRHLAQAILDGWSSYDGARTPGYPAFLALLGPDRAVYLAQLTLGLCVTALICLAVWLSTRNLQLVALAGLAHTLNLGQLFFETYLLSETLATFWVMLAIAGAAWWLAHPTRRGLLLAAGIGISAGLAGLTRPLYAFLPFWLAFALWALPAMQASEPGSIRLQRLQWRALVGVVLPGILLVGGWMGYIHYRTGQWNLTIVTGLHLTQHTTDYFEYTPDENADLREIFIRYREERLARYGTGFNTIWSAYIEMMQARGWNLSQLSQALTQISLGLIREHPDLYLRNAAEGWLNFWKPAVKWAPGQVNPPGLRQALTVLIFVERGGLLVVNLIFALVSLLALVSKRARRAWELTPFWALAAATVWVTSILQTLPEHGDNPRFMIPTQSLVVICVLWVVVAWVRKALTERKKTKPLLGITHP